MSGGKKRVCSALASLKITHGIEEVDKKRICKMANISEATAPSLFSRMVKENLIRYGTAPNTIAITDAGMEIAEPCDVITSNEEYHEQIKKELKGKAVQIFEILQDRQIHKKADIMKAINCTNKNTFAPLLSRAFAKNGYIQYPSRDTVQLSDTCFPFDE